MLLFFSVVIVMESNVEHIVVYFLCLIQISSSTHHSTVAKSEVQKTPVQNRIRKVQLCLSGDSSKVCNTLYFLAFKACIQWPTTSILQSVIVIL